MPKRYGAVLLPVMLGSRLAAQEAPRRIPFEVVAQYAAGSMIALITRCLENDLPIPPEEFSHQTLQLTAYGVY
jgi:hypothetical protein